MVRGAVGRACGSVEVVTDGLGAADEEDFCEEFLSYMKNDFCFVGIDDWKDSVVVVYFLG